MRRRFVLAFGLVLAAAACGGGSMSAPEYFTQLEAAAVAYDESAAEINEAYRIALDETIAAFAEAGSSADDEAALGALAGQAAGQTVIALGSTGLALEAYGDTVSELRPPGEAEDAHDEFMAALAALVEAVQPTVDVLAAVSSVDGLGLAVAGSPFNDARPRAERACLALQEVGGATGNSVDLRCESFGERTDDDS